MGKNKTTKHAQLDFGLALLITGGLANIALWIGVFVTTESQGPISRWIQISLLPIVGGISGLAMAFTLAASLIYILSKLADMKPSLERKVRGKNKYKTIRNYRFYTAWAAVIILLLLSLALLSPYVYMMLAGKSNLYAVMGDRGTGAWALGRVLAADIAIGVVALVRGVHISAVAQTSGKTVERPQAKSRAKKKPLKNSLSEIPCSFAGAGCGRTFASQNAANAHARTCGFKPTVAMPVNITEQLKKK